MLVEKVKRWSLWMSGESTAHLIEMKTGIRNKGTMRGLPAPLQIQNQAKCVNTAQGIGSLL